jgi:hypothetical protein
MLKLISKGLNILKNDGLEVLIVRLFKYSIVKIKRLYIKTDYEIWENLKGKFNGKRIFILGNGPSLNYTPLYYLKGEYTMCFNRVNLMLDRLNWNPTFYVMTDDLLIKDMSEEVKKEIIPKVKYAFFPDIHPSNVNFKKRIGKYPNVYYLNTDSPGFQTVLPKCGINKTVVNAGIQIAAFLGFSEIYLLGVDMTFGDQKVKKSNSRNWTAGKDDDPNHFDPRYFGKGRSYHNPTVHEMLEQFEKAKIFSNNIGIKIYNAGIGGKLEVFPRKSFENLFNLSTLNLENLFLDLSFPGCASNFEKDILEKFPIYKTEKELELDSEIFLVNSELFQIAFKKSVLTHIAFGPYKEYYLFKKRNS